MAAFFFHWLVLEHLQPSLQHTTAQLWCDNMAAISWATKLKSSTDPLATRILRHFAYRLHVTRASPFKTNYIKSANNKMADMASRPHSRDPPNFLTSVASAFPPPQHNSWNLFLPPTPTSTNLLHPSIHKHPQPEKWENQCHPFSFCHR
jgi:hypothetical protein